MGKNILKVQNLNIDFKTKFGFKNIINNISFNLGNNEILCIVGESGCGKTTLAKMLLGLLPPTSGEINLDGTPINTVNIFDIATKVQPVFQDPYSSLNPRMLVKDIIREPLNINTNLSDTEKNEKVDWLLNKVGLSIEQSNRYPHEFSGGQRQRIGIARSLATDPEIIIADEPVSALDVSIQAQIINLMMDLQARVIVR